MGLRFRKSVTICKGVRLNFNKNSLGMSFGTKGARYTINSNGKKTASVGIPGTGIYYTQSTTKKQKNTSNNKRGCLNIVLWIVFFPFMILFFYI